MGAARCVRCAKRKQVPDAVDHTVGRHAVGTLVTDGVCTVEGVAALLRARVRCRVHRPFLFLTHSLSFSPARAAPGRHRRCFDRFALAARRFL